jgi:PLP dependent protein
MYSRLLAENLPRVRERIAQAADRGGRDPASVRLVAVTKGHPLEALQAALEAGIRDLGENRLGELEEKRAALGEDTPAIWHMIGHLQRRKAPGVRPMAHLLHSLDSLKLAQRLERTAPEGTAPLPVLLQVNTSGEEAKYGFSPEAYRDQVGEVLSLPSLKVEGLMTMAPFTEDEGVLRATFRGLRELHEETLSAHPEYQGAELSMGMSNDFELAVEEGSTLVRLGTVLLGERPS